VTNKGAKMKFEKGDVLPVFQSFLVKVRNVPGISNCNNIFYNGDTASVYSDIEVRKVDYEKDLILFMVREAYNVGGSRAPNGTLFVKRISEFISEYKEQKHEEQVKENEEIQAWISEPQE
jgi:hypothetical protein